MATANKPAFKLGLKVTHAKHGIGKIIDITENNGTWLHVDFGDKKNPNQKSVRPGSVTKA